MDRGYNYELRKKYKSVLTGITVNGSSVPVYDYWAEDSATLPYIIIGDFFSNDDRNKCDDVEDCSVVLQVISAYRGQGGRMDADSIANEIFELKSQLRSTVAGLFVIADVYKINDLTTKEQTQTQKVYRRIITLGHTITQL